MLTLGSRIIGCWNRLSVYKSVQLLKNRVSEPLGLVFFNEATTLSRGINVALLLLLKDILWDVGVWIQLFKECCLALLEQNVLLVDLKNYSR